MNRREASKSETRELILNAARKLFLAKGVEQCTMRSIAKEAGVSPASVIVHFKNKTALLEIALYEEIGLTLSKAMNSFPASAPLLERLLHIPGAMYRFYDTNREVYRALIRRTLLEPDEENPHLARQLDGYLQFLEGQIEQEKGLGNVRREVDVSMAAASLASLYIGVLINYFRKVEITADMALGMLAEMTHQYLFGILVLKPDSSQNNGVEINGNK